MYIHPASFKVLHKPPPKVFFRCLNGLKYLDDVEYEDEEVFEEMPVLWYDELIILKQKDENFRCLHKQKD
jgi:hypothetical protein